MARIVVKLHGQEISRLTLESGREYVAGRAQDAQIHLDTQRGISRHHLKLCQRDGVWVCEALSKFGLLQIGTESLQVIELNQAAVFTVPPYEFVFDPEVDGPSAAAENEPGPPAGSENLPAFFQPRIPLNGSGGSAGIANAGGDVRANDTSARANNEATVAGATQLVPYLRISYPNTADEEVLKLEGELWVAGRESACEIPIDSAHISRKHFELARTTEGFFITDLGSSNGTKLNGEKLPAHEPTRIESGDEIRVQNIEMTFEIRDTHFAQKLDRLPVAAASFDPGLALSPAAAHYPQANLPAMYEPTQYRSPEELALAASAGKAKGFKRIWKDLRKNKVRLALVILAPLVLILALLPDKSKNTPANPRDPASPSFEKLSKEQKLVVKDSFNLARNLYVQGKYALCLTELAKLHELIPQYENSKELQSFCDQGLELVRREDERLRQQREREEVEQRISGFVDQCKAQLGAKATVEETRRCLAPAVELAPEHPLVVELIHSAQMHEEEARFMASQKKTEDAKAAKGVAHFKRAMEAYKQGRLAIAIKDFEKFVIRPYPRSETMKEQAKRQIASIGKELKEKVDALLAQCKDMGSKQKYKLAHQACTKAAAEDPSNKEADELADKYAEALRLDLKSIYEDSVLEESLGNVDTAKEKWKKILLEDLPTGEYAKKARAKLKSHGAGL